MPPDGLTAAIVPLAAREIRFVQPGMVSLTNVTEPGTIYTAAKAATLKAVAEEHGLPCHIDGARFANVLVAAGGTAPELAWKAGIDVLSLAARRSA